MPMDLKRRIEKSSLRSAGVTMLGVQGNIWSSSLKMPQEERVIKPPSMHRNQKTQTKAAVPPFSSSLNVNMEKSFRRGSLVGATGTQLGFYSPRRIFVSIGKHLILMLDVEQHKL